MIDWLKGFWRGLVDEIFMKSNYGKQMGTDTFFRWVVCVIVFVGFYFWVYNFDARGVETDKWFHEAFGWKLSDVPSPAKVSWHRIAAGGLAAVTISAATGEYLICLFRRIKARIAASKARKESERFVS